MKKKQQMVERLLEGSHFYWSLKYEILQHGTVFVFFFDDNMTSELPNAYPKRGPFNRYGLELMKSNKRFKQ